jgi:transposase
MMEATMERHALRDDQFARIEHLLPGRPGTVGRNSEVGNRLFVEAVIWKFRVGTPWHDLPERFGGWCNTHKRFSRWAASGVWANLFKALANDPCRQAVNEVVGVITLVAKQGFWLDKRQQRLCLGCHGLGRPLRLSANGLPRHRRSCGSLS